MPTMSGCRGEVVAIWLSSDGTVMPALSNFALSWPQTSRPPTDHPIPCRLLGGARVEAEHAALHAIAYGLKPCSQLPPALSIGQPLDAAADLADGDGADVEFALVLAQPCDDLRVRLRLHRLAIHIRVNEVAHSDCGSRSSASRAGISKVEGQASSRSTRPRFAGWVMRRRVMVSSSSMETSK